MRLFSVTELLGWGSTVGGPSFLSSSHDDQIPVLSDSIHFDEPQPRPRYIDGVRSGTTGVSLSLELHDGIRNRTAPYLGGLLFEDISQSGDGGLYAELLRNRAFQGSGVRLGSDPRMPYRSIVYAENAIVPFGPVLDGWTAIGDARLSLDLLHPASDDLPVSLQVDIPLDATGKVGFQNDGWWGIPVTPQTYNVSFWTQASGARFNWTITHFKIGLDSALKNVRWCESTIPVDNRITPFEPRRFEGSIECESAAPNINNTFTITFDAAEARGQTLYFSLLSLFPETYKSRPNGLRKDLAENLEALNPQFLRFPGGNNLEGYSVQRRWKWWKTIGPLKDRPGRPGDWSYYNTDGLGLLEYLIWCEDMNMAPLLAVYAGFSLEISVYDNSNSTDANEYPLDRMDEVLQEALEELEYCMGDPETTHWGKKRAQHGHPEPFNIPMIEIGNEDWFSHRYPERAEFMYQGLKKQYPDIIYIFSALNETEEFKMNLPEGSIWDQHVYAPAGYFIKNFHIWDNFQSVPRQQNVHASLMEYHASIVGVSGVTNRHPRIGAAVAEAVAAIAGERNPDTYRLSCFAPLIQNLNAWRGTPYDILFTADPIETVLSASYWQQWLFNKFAGVETVTVRETGGDGLNPLFWVASAMKSPEGKEAEVIYFKIVNAGNFTQRLDLHLDVPFTAVNGTILAPPTEGDLFAFNYIGDQRVVPKEIPVATIGLTDGKGEMVQWIEDIGGVMIQEKRASGMQWGVPAFSIAVLQFDLIEIGKDQANRQDQPVVDCEAEVETASAVQIDGEL